MAIYFLFLVDSENHCFAVVDAVAVALIVVALIVVVVVVVDSSVIMMMMHLTGVESHLLASDLT